VGGIRFKCAEVIREFPEGFHGLLGTALEEKSRPVCWSRFAYAHGISLYAPPAHICVQLRGQDLNLGPSGYACYFGLRRLRNHSEVRSLDYIFIRHRT